jgi:hypothetical protein
MTLSFTFRSCFPASSPDPLVWFTDWLPLGFGVKKTKECASLTCPSIHNAPDDVAVRDVSTRLRVVVGHITNPGGTPAGTRPQLGREGGRARGCVCVWS